MPIVGGATQLEEPLFRWALGLFARRGKPDLLVRDTPFLRPGRVQRGLLSPTATRAGTQDPPELEATLRLGGRLISRAGFQTHPYVVTSPTRCCRSPAGSCGWSARGCG